MRASPALAPSSSGRAGLPCPSAWGRTRSRRRHPPSQQEAPPRLLLLRRRG
uniref:Uncharacterized protein n=1 Tax=Arundo donax TaxID=35708 RepID=A0A0A9FK92_ARUDO